MENGKFRMIPAVPIILNKRNVCCGLTVVVLNVIAWPSFVLWILIDVGLLSFLILPRLLRFIRKTPNRVDIMNPGGVKNSRGGFGSVMSEASNGHTCNTSTGTRIRSSSRRTKYNHEFSRCTPDQRDTRTPLPTISAIRNRLSYSTVEASIRSTTPTPFSPSGKSTLQERNRTMHNPSRPIHHNHTPNESRSSVLHIARTNLPAAREACSPVIVKVAPLGTSPRLDLVETKHNNPDSCSKDVVVNALKQITQRRKRVCPLSDSREDDDSFLDNLPSIKKSRQEPTTQLQTAVKRTWATAAITNENLLRPAMPETKKHKASSDVTEKPPSLVQESTVVLPPVRTTQMVESQNTEETKITTPPIDKEVTQILNTSDKENKSLDDKNESLSGQDKVSFGILKKLRTVYPSSKPSIDAMRRKYPILCSSGVAPKLGRQTSKLKYEDYIKDREDVYAKVKRVLEEVDEAELQKKKKEEKPAATTESTSILSGTLKSVPSASTVSQVNVTASAPVEVTTAKTLLSISSTASTCSTVAPPPNVVISSTLSEIIPTAASSSGQQPSIVLPVPALAKLTSKPAEASSAVTNDNLTVPTMPSLVGKATGNTSQMFSFALPNAPSTANASSSQPTLNFSMPVSSTSTTTSSSAAGLSLSSPLGMEMTPSISSSLGMGTALGVPSSLGTGLGVSSSLGMGTALSVPSLLGTGLGVSSSLGMGTALGVPSSLGTGLGLPSSSLGGGFKPQLPSTTTAANTVQLQANLLHTNNTVVTSSGQVGSLFSANTTGTNINFSTSNKPSIFPTLATATTTNAVNLTGNLFTSSACGVQVASLPQSNPSFGTALNNNGNLFSSSSQANVTTANTFTGLFAPASGIANNVIASSTRSLFGNPQTTIINTTANTITTTSGQPFIFNIFQSSHTTTAPSNPIQFGGQMTQSSFSNTSTLFNQPQTQAPHSGFNFMNANTNTTPNFSFNLQPSVGGANSSLPFTAPPGGFNLPSTATAQPRRKTKTPTRSKPKRK